MKFQLIGSLFGRLKTVPQLRWLCTIKRDWEKNFKSYYVRILNGDVPNLFPDTFLSFASRKWGNPRAITVNIYSNVEGLPSRYIKRHIYTTETATRSCPVTFSRHILTFWRRKCIFLILAHPVYKMWIIQEPNTLELWNKRYFEEKKTESI